MIPYLETKISYFKKYSYSLIVAIFFLQFTLNLYAQKNDLIIAVQLEPTGLDPRYHAAAAVDAVLQDTVLEGLLTLDKKGQPAANLAQKWQMNKEANLYTFELVENVFFHNGLPLDAQAVKANFIAAAQSPNLERKRFSNIEKIVILSPLVLEIHLQKSDPDWLYLLAAGEAVIFPSNALEEVKEKPLGSGAFRFDSWQHGTSISLVRNDEYWGQKPAFEKVVFYFISDPNAAFSRTMAGDIDLFLAYPSPETLNLFDKDKRFKVYAGLSQGETLLAMNKRKEALKKLKVRSAIAHAIDRRALIDGAMYGYGAPIGSHFPPQDPDYIDLLSYSAYQPDLARQLLKEAGYEKGLKLNLVLPPPSYARRSGELLVEQLAAVGIELQVVPVEWAQWLDRVYKRYDYDLTIVAHTEARDIDIYARSDYYFAYPATDLQQLFNRWETAFDPFKRRQLIQQIQTYLAQNYVNGFLFQMPSLNLAKRFLQGLRVQRFNESLSELKWLTWQDE